MSLCLLPSAAEAQGSSGGAKIKSNVSSGLISRDEWLKNRKAPGGAQGKVATSPEDEEGLGLKGRLTAAGAKDSKELGAQFSRPVKSSLYTGTKIITNGTDHTVVPETGVIHLPPRWAAQVVQQPVGQLKSWPEFFAQSKAWIKTVEVSVDQVQGKEPLSELMVQDMMVDGANKIIVAVYKGSPVSLAAAKPDLSGANPAEGVGSQGTSMRISKPTLAQPGATSGTAASDQNSGQADAPAGKPASKPASAATFSLEKKSADNKPVVDKKN